MVTTISSLAIFTSIDKVFVVFGTPIAEDFFNGNSGENI